jgi:predicted cobalt transporter CbtA
VIAPSIHEGRYPAIFTLLNFPALLVVSRPLKWIEGMFPEMTSRTSDLLALAGCLIFWLALALVIGLLLDRYRRRHVLDISHERA